MIDEALARKWLAAFAPPPRVAPSTFAEGEIRLPASANAIPGPLRLAPYQRELVDAIAADDCEVVVMMLSSQTGKSISIDAQLGHCIACEPGPILHVSPTGKRGEEFVRDRFDPLVAASPALRALIGKGRATRRGGSGGINSIASKSFPGGQLNFALSFKPDELAARAIKFLFLDEIDHPTARRPSKTWSFWHNLTRNGRSAAASKLFISPTSGNLQTMPLTCGLSMFLLERRASPIRNGAPAIVI
jgi:phage terminase large subunit GpA-like protein